MRKFLVILVLVPVAYAQAQIRFENVAEEAGIDDPGVNGAGVAFWDYDHDGDVERRVSLEVESRTSNQVQLRADDLEQGCVSTGKR